MSVFLLFSEALMSSSLIHSHGSYYTKQKRRNIVFMKKINGPQFPNGNEKTVYNGKGKMVFHFLEKMLKIFFHFIVFTVL